jgi:glycine/D-amino acid oxidase-like deaminating enzyme
MSFDFNRRDFLRGAAATSALLIAARSRALAAFHPQRHFAPVKVSRDRVIREVVGLRPFRPEGFRVEAERAGNKLFIHNYGHGGAGITLSWGTASLAVDMLSDPGIAQPKPTRRTRSHQGALRFAVLGCGVNGLSTVRLLQRRYSPAVVTIYAKNLPPETTSNIAGGFWSPTSLYDDGATTAKFDEQFRQACRISNRAFQLLAGPEYGVRWIDTYELHRSEGPIMRELPGGNDLYPQSELHVNDAEHYFGFPYVRQYSTMLIEPPVYLNTLLRDFYVAGGKVVVKEFRSREEINRLAEPVIFNCTGLGARALFNDEKLEPVRGQLEVLLPQPEIDYIYLGTGYMFPRRDGIILGGTFDHGDWSLAPDPGQANGILNAHAEIMKGLKQ